MFASPSKVNSIELQKVYYDENGLARVPVNIDQSMCIKGNENSFGYPESDIALMLKAQSQDEIAFYMSKMRDLRLNDKSNEGLTDEQIAAKVIPAGMNTPVSYANAVVAAQKYFLEIAEQQNFETKEVSTPVVETKAVSTPVVENSASSSESVSET